MTMSIDATRAALMTSHHRRQSPKSKPRRATVSASALRDNKPSRHSSSRRRVTISETSQMVYVADLSEGPAKPDLWFSREEMERFKAGVSSYVRTVRLHIANGRAPSAAHVLGVEKFLTPQLTDEYRRRRERLFDDVVAESHWQREQIKRAEGCHGREVTEAHLDFFADRLAETAAEGSRWAQERARAAALFLYQDQAI